LLTGGIAIVFLGIAMVVITAASSAQSRPRPRPSACPSTLRQRTDRRWLVLPLARRGGSPPRGRDPAGDSLADRTPKTRPRRSCPPVGGGIGWRNRGCGAERTFRPRPA
jgi:hypothetical protein